jgi:hypothetical protein
MIEIPKCECRNVVLTFSDTMTLSVHSGNDESHLARHSERYSRSSGPTQSIGHYIKWFWTRISILIYNSWFRMKSVQSNRESELSVGEARRSSHSKSYLLSPNSSNHYVIATDRLKLNKSMSSRKLRHLTCLQTAYTFWRGIPSICPERLAPGPGS